MKRTYIEKFESYSSEKLIIANEILDFLIDRYYKPSILDVGSGTGLISQQLSSFSSSIVSIEPNRMLYLTQRIKANNIFNIKVYNEKIESFVSKIKFDVIILSHVVSHFDLKLIFNCIERFLHKDSIVIVVQQSKKSGQLKLEKYIYRKIFNNEMPYNTIEDVNSYIKHITIDSVTNFLTTSLTSKRMEEIINLLFDMMCIKPKLRSNVSNTCLAKFISKENNIYKLQSLHGITFANIKL